MLSLLLALSGPALAEPGDQEPPPAPEAMPAPAPVPPATPPPDPGAHGLINPPGARVRLALGAELGFLAVLRHRIQFGSEGSEIDYVGEGGQDVLFPFARAQAEVSSGRHTVTFLVQPLVLDNVENTRRDLIIDGATFAEGTPVRYRYAFPFYRVSWRYDLVPRPDLEVGLGLSLQLRNATITFETLDGSLLRTNRDLGPVPVLKAVVRKDWAGGWFLGGEADGFYAPISYLNGSDEDVTGAILDGSLRVGRELRLGVEAFVNLRYLGGGAVGTNEDDPLVYTDGYVRNWLHFATLSLGATVF